MTATHTTGEQAWLRLPSGLLVSADRMTYKDEILTLYRASRIDVPAFEAEARKYDVQISEQDPPITRLVKVALLQSRQSRDGSRLPTFQKHLAFSIDTATRKRAEPFRSLYRTLTTNYADATRDVLEFHDRSGRGYRATLYRFGDDGKLQPVDDLTIPLQGWIRAFGPRYGLPAETSQEEGPAHLDVPLVGSDAAGFWFVGDEPKKGEQRPAFRVPDWRRLGGGLLTGAVCLGPSSPDEEVAALLVRDAHESAYAAECARLQEIIERLQGDLNAEQEARARLARLLPLGDGPRQHCPYSD